MIALICCPYHSECYGAILMREVILFCEDSFHETFVEALLRRLAKEFGIAIKSKSFSSAGGLLTTATDLGKYIAFHLSAWPPRDDPETGPVRRSSVREMAHMWNPSNLTATRPGGKLQVVEAGPPAWRPCLPGEEQVRWPRFVHS